MVFFPPPNSTSVSTSLKSETTVSTTLESVFLPIGWTDILEVILDEDVPR